MNVLFAAIQTKYDADSTLSDAMTGGLSLFRAKQKPSYPYAVCFPITEQPLDTFTEDIENFLIQFNIYDDAKTESPTNINTLKEYLYDCFDDCSLAVAGYHHIFMQRRRSFPLLMTEESYQYSIEYAVEIQKMRIVDCDGQYRALAASSAINDVTTENICLSAWIKADSTMGDANFIIEKYASVTGYRFLLTTGLVFMRIDAPVANFIIAWGNTDLRDDEWHHIAATMDRAGTGKIYVDGEEDGTTNIGGTMFADSLTNAGTFSLGVDTALTTEFEGRIADVKFYKDASSIWSDAQVAYQAANPFDYSSGSGTITEYWRCTEGAGLTLNGSDDNDLTLSSVEAWTEDGPS